MTEDEIKLIVLQTVKELKREGMLRDFDDVIYSEMSERLTKFFRGAKDIELGNALQNVADDWYFEIIPLYFRNGMTTEAIAHHIGADVSTVSRNRRRLLLKLYNLIA